MKSVTLIVCALVIAIAISIALPLECWIHRQQVDDAPTPLQAVYGDSSDHMKAEAGFLDRKAPDFTLPRLEGGHALHLADMIGPRPIVLVFGSFDCVYFCGRVNRLIELHLKFKSRADFVFVYLCDDPHREWARQAAAAGAPLEPDDLEAFIRAKMREFNLALPCVLASDKDHIGNVYDAYPGRLFIVDRAGRIALDSSYVQFRGLDLERADSWLEEHSALDARLDAPQRTRLRLGAEAARRAVRKSIGTVTAFR